MKALARVPAVVGLSLVALVSHVGFIRPMVERAYAGHSFPWLNAWAADSGRTAERWLSRLDWALVGLVALLLIPALLRWLVAQHWMQRRVGLASPGELGVLRAGVCLLALSQVLGESMEGLPTLHADLRHSMGVVRLLRALPNGLEELLYSDATLSVLHAGTVAALVLALLGIWTQRSLAAALVLNLVCGGLWREVTHFFHSGVVPLYLLGVLLLCDSGAGFSLDYLRRVRAGGQPRWRRKHFQAFGWARWCLWISVAVPYLLAGLSKLRESGVAWAAPTNIASILLRDSLNVPDFDFGLQPLLLGLPDSLLLSAGLLTLLGELGFILVGASPVARFVFPALMFGMHAGTLLFQGFTFWDSLFLDGALCVLAVAWPFGVRRPRHDRVRRFLHRFEPVWLAAARPIVQHLQPSESGGSALSAAFALWVAVQFLVWALRIDLYPLTQWRMYAERSVEGVIHYWTVETRDHVGRVGGNVLKDCPRVFERDARYRDLLMLVRDAGIPAGVRDAFRTCARNYDARVSEPERKLTMLRVQRWRWEFRPGSERRPRDPVSERDFSLDLREPANTDVSPARPGADVSPAHAGADVQ
jgi:hypothetical protein